MFISRLHQMHLGLHTTHTQKLPQICSGLHIHAYHKSASTLTTQDCSSSSSRQLYAVTEPIPVIGSSVQPHLPLGTHSDPTSECACHCCRDRERSSAAFHAALRELQSSPLLAQCHVSVTAADDLAGTELMSVASDAATAVGMIEVYMRANADGHSWQGDFSPLQPPCVWQTYCKKKF